MPCRYSFDFVGFGMVLEDGDTVFIDYFKPKIAEPLALRAIFSLCP